MTCAPDPTRVHFRPAEQVVQSTHSIPHSVQRKAGTQQQQRSPCLIVFASRTEKAFLRLGIQVLQPLALSEWVEGKNHVSLSRKVLVGALVITVRLPFLGMTKRGEYPRKGWLRKRVLPTWYVEVGSDIDVRLAFEDDLFDGVLIPLNLSNYPRIEGSPFKRASDDIPDMGTYRFNTIVNLFWTPKVGQLCFASVASFVHHPGEVERPVVPIVPLSSRAQRG